MKTRILIVDANAETLRTIKQVLASDSLVLHFAQSEDEALREVLSTQFSLVLVASSMPLMAGSDAVRLLRKVKKNFSASIMVLETAPGTIPQDTELFDLGVVDCLHHPWSYIVLKNKVDLFVRLEQQRLQAHAQGQAFQLMKDYFMGMMSQELREPISALLGHAKTLRNSQEEPHKQAALVALQKECDKLLRWVERVERGKTAPTSLQDH